MTYECSLCFCLKFGFGLQMLYLSSKPKVLKLIDLSNPFNSEGQFLICIVPSGSKLICLQNKGKHWQQQKKLVSVILLGGRPLNQNFSEKLMTCFTPSLSFNIINKHTWKFKWKQSCRWGDRNEKFNWNMCIYFHNVPGAFVTECRFT